MPLGIRPMDVCGGGMREESLRASAWKATCELARAAKGLFTWENTHWLKLHTGVTLHLHVCMFFPRPMTDMMTRSWIDENYACASCSSPPADWFHTKKSGCSCLHDTVAKFCTGVKFPFWYNNRGELTPVWLVPAWHFAQTGWYRVNKYRATRETLEHLELTFFFLPQNTSILSLTKE